MKIETLDIFGFKKAVDSNIPFIVEFKSKNCYVCNDLDPIYETMPSKFPNLQFYKVDVNEEEELAQLFVEDGVPTIYFINGRRFKMLEYPENGFDKKSLTKEIIRILNEGRDGKEKIS